MEMKLTKLWPLVGAMCLSLASSAFAQDSNQSSSSTYGSNMNSSSESEQGTYQRGTFREITPSAGPRVAHGADVFVTADFIWWKAVEEGLDLSATGYNNDSANQFSSPKQGKIASVGSDWAPGFKVGLGLNLGHDGWDLATQYTWLRPLDSASQHNPSKLPSDGIIPSENGVEKVAGKWKHRFNVIDLELGRNFYLSQFLTMRPFVGLKGTWQSRDFKQETLLKDGQTSRTINGTNVTGPATLKDAYKVWGVGPRAGLNTAWHMTKSFSMYGNLALSTLWTHYYSNIHTGSAFDKTANKTRGISNIDNDDVYTCRYVSEMELGLRWETWFYDDNYHVAIQAGWEGQFWPDFAVRVRNNVERTSSNFSTQGLNLKLRFDF